MKLITLILFFLLVVSYDIIEANQQYDSVYYPRMVPSLQPGYSQGYNNPYFLQGSQTPVSEVNVNTPGSNSSNLQSGYPMDASQYNDTNQPYYPSQGVPVSKDAGRNNLRRIPDSFDASHLNPITRWSYDKMQYFNSELKKAIITQLAAPKTFSKNQIFNMLVNTNEGEIIDAIQVDDYNYKRCKMEKKTEPHAWFSNPKYNYTVGCGISREKVIVDLTIKRGIFGGNVTDIKIDNVKINYHIKDFKKWSEDFLQIMTGRKGQNIKSKTNKWWKKRKKIVLGILAVGAASAAGIAGGYVLRPHIDNSPLFN